MEHLRPSKALKITVTSVNVNESKLFYYLSFRNRSQGEALGTIPCGVHEQFLFHSAGGAGRWCSPCVIVRTSTIVLFLYLQQYEYVSVFRI